MDPDTVMRQNLCRLLVYQCCNSELVGGSIIPINDLRGAESLNYSKGEKVVRCKLAAMYRMADMFGWSQGIYSHITVSRPTCKQEKIFWIQFSAISVDQRNTCNYGSSNSFL